MRVPWSTGNCILCLRKKQLTDEHLIPEALGGKLSCAFLCDECNSRMGHSFEAAAKKDPALRIAVQKLAAEVPDLSARLMEGQTFTGKGAGASVSGRVKAGSFRVTAQKASDGSLFQETQDAVRTIERILRKRGVAPTPIAKALEDFENAPENVVVSIQGLKAVKWRVDSISPNFGDAQTLSPLLPFKIAFEFLACHLGSSIVERVNQLDDIRRCLQSGVVDDDVFGVEYLTSREYAPLHGICFEGNEPYAKVQIRLFGWLAFRVHLKRLSVGGPRYIYTHDLKTGREGVQVIAS